MENQSPAALLKIIEAKDNELIKVIAELSDATLEITAQDIPYWTNRLDQIYADEGEQEDVYRHSYARLSRYLYDNFGESQNEGITLLIEHIEFLLAHIQNPKTRKAVRKLYDHIQLEVIHISRLRELPNLSSALWQAQS